MDSTKKSIFQKSFLFLITFFIFFGLSIIIHNPNFNTLKQNLEQISEYEYCIANFEKLDSCDSYRLWIKNKAPGIIIRNNFQHYYWIRLKIQKNILNKFTNPYLYLAHHVPFSVFINNKLIYAVDSFKQNPPPFVGFNKNHFIKIPNNYSKYIYIYKYKHYIADTITSPIYIGEFTDLLLQEFISELDIVILSIFYFVLSIFSIMIYFKEREYKSFLYISLLSICTCGAGFYITEIKKYIYDNPLLYTYLFIPCIFAIGLILQTYFISLFGNGYKSSFRISQVLFFIFFLTCFGISTFHNPYFYYFSEFPFVLLCFLSLLNLIGHLIYFIKKGNTTAIYLGLGIVSLVASLLKLFLYHMGIQNFEGNHYIIGFLGFFIGLVFASGEEYFDSKKKLKNYTENLENIIIERTEEIENQNKIILEEKMKMVYYETENKILKERENLFADIHDNLGGKLLDLSLNLEGMLGDELNNNDINGVLNNIENVRNGIKNKLLTHEDLYTLENNFLLGFELLLTRRYNNAGREIEINITKQSFETNFNNTFYPIFLSLINEIINNDLKYGYGKSKWNIENSDNKLSFSFKSNSKLEIPAPRGKGYYTIRKRIETLNGEFIENISNGFYLLELSLPLNNFKF